jgi:hypothetical protein
LLGLGLLAVALGVNADEANSNKKSVDENAVSETSKELKRNIWLELGAGSASTIEIKTTLANRGWALASTNYDKIKAVKIS